MGSLIEDIFATLRATSNTSRPLTPDELDHLIRKHSRELNGNHRYKKRNILPAYLHIKEHSKKLWESWHIDPELEHRFLLSVRMKPRRTASGVSTITVITRPYTCSSNCLYCPCDLRMPKSYLYHEPACQRAEQNYFDPYLQVTTRLRALRQMGHATDKIELIVLGGTWSDYPQSYQIWFIKELFRALNEWPNDIGTIRSRYQVYRGSGLSNQDAMLQDFVSTEQEKVYQGKETFNQAWHKLYDHAVPYQTVWRRMAASLEELKTEQKKNETAAQRMVGLVIETRPDAITPESLRFFRTLGCTKVQVGIQSTRQQILDINHRATTIEQISRTLNLIRLYGFKIHTHLMVNLLGSDPEADKKDFETFVEDKRFLPDEIKLYPCTLVQGTALVKEYEEGHWKPYSEDELLDVLVHDTLVTPSYVRISRMIRDISAQDIMVGNKKANLRQMVEQKIEKAGESGLIHDIRYREIARKAVDLSQLTLDDVPYKTLTSSEHFLQWVTPDNHIVGFLRLSLPHWDELATHTLNVTAEEVPTEPGEAMIREVHVYGQEAHLGKADASAQHRGLGRQLIDRAKEIARGAGYSKLNVVSAVGTREYYRHLGFKDNGLYQRIDLTD